MKKRHGGTRKRTLGLCMLMATLFFGSAVAKADVVLDWNAIAVNTAVANKPEPIRPGTIRSDRTTRGIRIRERHHWRVSSLSRNDRAPPGASPDAAAIQAAYRVLSAYFPASRLDP